MEPSITGCAIIKAIGISKLYIKAIGKYQEKKTKNIGLLRRSLQRYRYLDNCLYFYLVVLVLFYLIHDFNASHTSEFIQMLNVEIQESLPFFH